MVNIEESELPGVGKKYTLTGTESGDTFAIIVHIGGRREVYRFPKGKDECDAVFEFGDEEAKKAGAILSGAYFTPQATEKLEMALKGIVIEWVDVKAGAPLAGSSLRDAQLRTRTGITVIAVLRAGTTHANPPPEFDVRPGDTIVAVGLPEQVQALRRLALGDAGDRGGRGAASPTEQS